MRQGRNRTRIRKRLRMVPWPSVRTDSVPACQADPRREAIRRQLMRDVVRLKLVALCSVAVAGLTLFLTESVLLYILLGLLGAAGIHVLGFLWARNYFSSAAPRADLVALDPAGGYPRTRGTGPFPSGDAPDGVSETRVSHPAV